MGWEKSASLTFEDASFNALTQTTMLDNQSAGGSLA